MNKLEEPPSLRPVNGLPVTLALRTRRAYDRMSRVYGLTSSVLHSRAHQQALDNSGVRVGIDLAPNMASLAQRKIRRRFPLSAAQCHAVDARSMPFRDGSFDLVVCCYLLELLSSEDIVRTVDEFHRVLRARGRLALVMISQGAAAFNSLYRVLGKLAPAFWGRQVEERVPELIVASDFRIVSEQVVRQGFYPSRVLVAHK